MIKTQESPQPSLVPELRGIGDELADPPGALLDVAPGGVLGPEMIASAWAALLSRYPESPVAALRTDGLFVAMPPWFAVDAHPLLQGRSGIDLVVPEDRVSVIAAWDTMLARGAGRCVVHLAVQPTATVAFDLFDARASHGVHLLVITPAGAADARLVASRPQIAPAMPRFATIRKNERGVVLEVDEATTQILGRAAEDLVGGRTLEFTHPDDHALVIETGWRCSPAPARPAGCGCAISAAINPGCGSRSPPQSPQRPQAAMRGQRNARHLRGDGGR